MNLRRTKYRGRRIDNNKWVSGFYCESPITDGNSGLPPSAGWYFLSGGEKRHLIIQDGVAFIVDPETVGQYTGLKETCEEDVIKFTTFDYNDHDTQHIGVIRWCEGEFLVDATHGESNDEIYNLAWVFYQDDEMEIIGNAYENPELLEGVK